MPALESALLLGAAHEEGIVLADLVQTAGGAVVVSAGDAAGILGLCLVVAAVAPSGQGHSIGTLAHNDESEDGDEEEGEDLVEGHLT